MHFVHMELHYKNEEGGGFTMYLFMQSTPFNGKRRKFELSDYRELEAINRM